MRSLFDHVGVDPNSSDILSADCLAPSKLKTVWQAVIWSAVYLIWKARNAKIFQSKLMAVDDILFEIQLMSFSWILIQKD